MSVDPNRVQMEDAQGLLLWLSQLAVLGSTFNTLFSSWRLCYGAGTPAVRDLTLVYEQYSSQGVLILIH